MLKQVGGTLSSVGRIVRASHERFDGTGYPDGLAGEEIPIEARIICACDAFSAMTTNRPYRAAMALDRAIAELRLCAGSQFDPSVVRALIETVVREGFVSQAEEQPGDRRGYAGGSQPFQPTAIVSASAPIVTQRVGVPLGRRPMTSPAAPSH
jgi:HD-GYP domain-containing protein (c-di-GMP phosphodiesterase class II)